MGYLKNELRNEQEANSLPNLAFTPRKHEENSYVRTLIHVRPKVVPQSELALEGIKVASDTNPGKLAGLISKVLLQGDVATLVAMGPSPTNNVIKAMMHAQYFILKEDAAATGAILAATPVFQKCCIDNQERTRLLFHCFRASNLDF